jgi:hypothetical protein
LARFSGSQLILILALFLLGAWWLGFISFDTEQAQVVPITQQKESDGLVAVTKPVDFYLVDKYGGGGVASATLTIYNEDLVQLESLTTGSDGTISTSAAYRSGTVLWVKASKSNAMRWYKVVVPKMSPADAQALTVNGPITLEFFSYNAPSLAVRDSAGNTYTDGGSLNKTSGGTPGTSSVVLTVSWFQGTDNKGYMESFDPVNQVDWKAILVVKVSGTNYENVVVTGFPNSVEKGTAIYYWTEIDPSTLTKWKVGSEYKLPGTGSFTFSLDLTGYSGDAADLDIYIYYYADGDYFVQKGSWGPDSLSVISGAPYTINLVD